MGKIKELFEDKNVTGKAIKTAAAKKERRDKIAVFVEKYGRGDIGLTEEQKQARIEKFLAKSEEIEKVKGLGINKSTGVDISSKKQLKLSLNRETRTVHDPVDQEIIATLSDYPRDHRAMPNKDGTTDDMRIVYAGVKDNGEMEIEHIHFDGNENDPRTRAMSGVLMMDDYTLALHEAKQYKDGILKEVSDRSMAILDDEEVLDQLFEDDSIDTDEDKELQI